MLKKEIPKRSGGFRTVYVPGPREKAWMREYGWRLQELGEQLLSDCVHGFRPGRSPVTNALAHVGKEYTLSVDLADFFSHCTRPLLLAGGVPADLVDWVVVEGAAQQGLPSSPAACNLAAAPMDKAILAAIPAGTVYTRYADDLTFSSDSLEDLKQVRSKLVPLAASFGQEVNGRKVRIQWAGYGRRRITGVAVDGKGVYPTRKLRRRLRAVAYQAARSGRPKLAARARGLAEWARLKAPGGRSGGKLYEGHVRWVARQVAERLEA